MTEIPVEEKTIRRNIAALLRLNIITMADGQRNLRAQVKPLWADGSENAILQADVLYKERLLAKYEIRTLCLAYAFLRGVPYAALERSCHEAAPFPQAIKLVLHALDRVNPGVNADLRGVLKADFKLWREGKEQAFFRKAAEDAEALPACAE